MIPIRSPWTRQPQRLGVGFDTNSPLAAGCVSFGTVLGGVPFDLRNNLRLSPSGSAGLNATRLGIAATTAAGSSDVWSAALPTISMSGRNTGSVWALCYSTVSSTTRKRVIRFSNSTSGTILFLDIGTGTVNNIFGGGQGAGAVFFDRQDTGASPPANALFSLLFTRQGTTMGLYLNGVEIGDINNAASSANWAADINQIFLGNNSSTFPLQGGVVAWGAWNRRLEERDAYELYVNPWQLIPPGSIIVPFTAPAGGLPTLTALTASNITTSGWRATLTAA